MSESDRITKCGFGLDVIKVLLYGVYDILQLRWREIAAVVLGK